MTLSTGSRPVELKIAYIGGGSREWARKLMFDLALCPDLAGQVALYDIDVPSARLNEALGNWLQEQPGVVSAWRYTAVERLEEALRGADFVVLSIQPGTLECMAEEIALAERHGMFFPVGDTTGAPGLVRGLRAATIYAGFAQAIDAICPRVGDQLHQSHDDLHAHADPRRAGAEGLWLLSRGVRHPGDARKAGRQGPGGRDPAPR